MTTKESIVTRLKNLVFIRFPETTTLTEKNKTEQTNPAIHLYGLRLYKDQTSVEYLSEFLLAFSSPKLKYGNEKFKFSTPSESQGEAPCYYPENHVALKLFSFFSTSKLETRHPIHRESYKIALKKIEDIFLQCTKEEKKESIQLLQSMLNGLSGLSNERTWVTQCFLPISDNLLSREINWEHIKAVKGLKHDIKDWSSSQQYFSISLRNFMSRGGEVLFLQLVNTFNELENNILNDFIKLKHYSHVKTHIDGLKQRIETNLKSALQEETRQISHIVDLVENTLNEFCLRGSEKSSNFGWVPKSSQIEGLLFAIEMDNICKSNINSIDKISLLQTLCCMQVLRTLCFQARRIDSRIGETDGFIGNFAWIISNPNELPHGINRTLAHESFNQVESMLFRSLRNPILSKTNIQFTDRDLSNGDDNCYRHFNKFSKEIGLVIPRTGPGARFTLHQGLIRFLVAALIEPNERIRLTTFYQRVFAHYGIAIYGDQLIQALRWLGNDINHDNYSVSVSSGWVEEALKQGGFLIELSDAVSMVINPGYDNHEEPI